MENKNSELPSDLNKESERGVTINHVGIPDVHLTAIKKELGTGIAAMDLASFQPMLIGSGLDSIALAATVVRLKNENPGLVVIDLEKSPHLSAEEIKKLTSPTEPSFETMQRPIDFHQRVEEPFIIQSFKTLGQDNSGQENRRARREEKRKNKK